MLVADVEVMIMSTHLDRYVKQGHTKVEGWLQPSAIAAITLLSSIQEEAGIDGSMCEIGVHHGRLFILLALLIRAGENCVAYDLFDNQHENVDGSGAGNRAVLEQNLLAHGCDLSRCRIVAENSMRLTSQRVLQDTVLQPRIFSIDGGHTSEITKNDMTLAADCLVNAGIVVVDDYFNEAWPGVSEGVCAFMSKSSALLPLAIVGNKYLFTRSTDAHAFYLNRLRDDGSPFITRTQRAFGCEVAVLHLPRLSKATLQRLRSTGLWKAVRNTTIADQVRQAFG